MSEYYQISREEMEEFMREHGFELVRVDGTFELVYSKDVNVSGCTDLQIRVYSSVTLAGCGAREVGEDAIRVILWSKEYSKGVGKNARVYRVKGWAENLEKRIESVLATSGRLRCGCGGWFVERQGKFGRFLGCCRYPKCRNTAEVRRLEYS